MKSSRGYFSFFSAVAVVLMAYFIFSIYHLNSSILLESQGTSMLIDRLYFSRKNAENLFWKAALDKDRTPEKVIKWKEAIQSNTFSSAVWLGEELSPGNLTCNITFLKDHSLGLDLSNRIEADGRYEFVNFLQVYRGKENYTEVLVVNPPASNFHKPAFTSVLCFKNPEIVTYFSAGVGSAKSRATIS